MHDIHSLAAQNVDYLTTCYKDCCACIEAACLESFENHLREKGEVTIATFTGFAFQNTSDGKIYCSGRDIDKDGHEKGLVLTSILQKGAYLNAYEQFENEDERNAHFSKLKDERSTFDNTFTQGQKFKYLNFNNGQLGIPAFGDFTLAFPLIHFDTDSLVFLKFNSLTRKDPKSTDKQRYYFTSNNEAVAIEALTQDLATFEHFVPLIVLKRKDELENGTDIDYNLLILKPIEGNLRHRDYVEVITWQNVKIQSGVRLRTEKERFQAIFDAVSDFDREHEPMIRNLKELYELINSSVIITEYGI